MQHTGYALIDGDPRRGIEPATPRHWIVCLVFVIVAQWALGLLGSVTTFAVRLVSFFGMSNSNFDRIASEWFLALPSIAWLIIPFATVAFAAIRLSQHFDKRGPAALGLQWRAIPEAVPWVLAGLVAGSLVFWTFFLLAPGWAGETLAALTILLPATLIQSGAEEILFRGVLLAMLVARYGPLRGVLISAGLFALWHIYAGQGVVDAGIFVATTFIFGVTSAILVLHQGHLGGAIALHVIWNLVASVDAGLTNWNGAQGVLSMFGEGFWASYVANAELPWTIEDLRSGETMSKTFVPLLIETLLVLAACRSTVDKLLGGSGGAARENAAQP